MVGYLRENLCEEFSHVKVLFRENFELATVSRCFTFNIDEFVRGLQVLEEAVEEIEDVHAQLLSFQMILFDIGAKVHYDLVGVTLDTVKDSL